MLLRVCRLSVLHCNSNEQTSGGQWRAEAIRSKVRSPLQFFETLALKKCTEGHQTNWDVELLFGSQLTQHGILVCVYLQPSDVPVGPVLFLGPPFRDVPSSFPFGPLKEAVGKKGDIEER